MADQTLSVGEKRSARYSNTFMDHRNEIISAAVKLGVPVQDLLLGKLVEDSPMFQLYRHWMMLKHTFKTKWKDSDLNDIIALSLAATSCDYVVT